MGIISQLIDKTIKKEDLIDSSQLIQVLLDKGLLRLKGAPDEDAILKAFWEELIGNLPLPSWLQDMVIPPIIKKISDFQYSLGSSNNNAGSSTHKEIIQQLSENVSLGKDLVEYTRLFAHGIVDIVFKPDVDFAGISGMEKTVDNVIIRFFPSLQLDNDLKNWFRRNISALGEEKDNTLNSKTFLKETIHTLLMKGILETTDINREEKGLEFTRDLFSKIKGAYTHFFSEIETGGEAAVTWFKELYLQHE